MIVMGVFALILLNIFMIATIKFLILTVLTFIVTNALVYAYRRTIQNSLRKPTIMKLTVAAALLLTITVYAKQGSPFSNEEQHWVSWD